MSGTMLGATLVAPAGAVPLYVRRFQIDVDYAEAFAASDGFADHRRTVDDAVKEMQGALRLGFFAWSFFAERASASMTADWSRAGGLTLKGKADGLHHNVLTASLRLIIGLHHTPLAAFEELRRLIGPGPDADALPPRTIFSEIVRGIRFSIVEGTDERTTTRTDFTDYVKDDEIRLPRSAIPLSDLTEICDGERLVVTGQGLDPFPSAAFGKIENRFLELANTGCFRGPARVDDGVSDEAQIFARNKKTPQAEVVIDDYEEEAYGLVEFLNCVSDGRVDALSIADSQN